MIPRHQQPVRRFHCEEKSPVHGFYRSCLFSPGLGLGYRQHHYTALNSHHIPTAPHHITPHHTTQVFHVSEMDFLSNLVPSLELDPTSQYQNVTLLQETFIGAFLGTFIANLAAQTVRNILGESDKNSAQFLIQNITFQSETSPA